MKNQIQLSAEMLAKLMRLFKNDEITLNESPLGSITVPVKKIKFEANQVVIPLRIDAAGNSEMMFYFKLDSGIELGLE